MALINFWNPLKKVCCMGQTKEIYDSINEIIGHWKFEVLSSTLFVLYTGKGGSIYSDRYIIIFFFPPLFHSDIKLGKNFSDKEKITIGPIRSFILWNRINNTYINNRKKKNKEDLGDFFEI